MHSAGEKNNCQRAIFHLQTIISYMKCWGFGGSMFGLVCWRLNLNSDFAQNAWAVDGYASVVLGLMGEHFNSNMGNMENPSNPNTQVAARFIAQTALSSGLPSAMGYTAKAGESSNALAALAECRRCDCSSWWAGSETA